MERRDRHPVEKRSRGSNGGGEEQTQQQQQIEELCELLTKKLRIEGEPPKDLRGIVERLKGQDVDIRINEAAKPRTRVEFAHGLGDKGTQVVVLDTNVLLHELGSVFAIAAVRTGVAVRIPLAVVRELDGLKSSSDSETAQAARTASRSVMDLISSHGSTVDVQRHEELDAEARGEARPGNPDERIIAACVFYAKHSSSGRVSLISNDTNLRIKAKSWDIRAVTAPEWLSSNGISEPRFYVGSHPSRAPQRWSSHSRSHPWRHRGRGSDCDDWRSHGKTSSSPRSWRSRQQIGTPEQPAVAKPSSNLPSPPPPPPLPPGPPPPPPPPEQSHPDFQYWYGIYASYFAKLPASARPSFQ